MSRSLRVLWFGPLVGLLLASVACSGGGGPKTPPGWTMHNDPRGFSVQLPKEWKVQTEGHSGRVELDGPNGATLVVWPFFVNATLDDASASALLAQLAGKVLPQAQWQAPGRAGQGVVRMDGASGQTRDVSLLSWITGGEGTAGYVYFAAADRAVYPQLESTFSGILSSFRITGPPVTQQAGMQFVPWRDPAEGAFTEEVPKGWTVRGGTERPSSLLVQSKVELLSPDGKVYVYLGDDYPVFTEPNPTLALAGIGEGGLYPTGDYNSPVEYYAPGVQFLFRYVLPRLAPGGHVVSQVNRPDVASQIPTTGINSYDAGEVEFAFDRNGQSYRGGAFIVTEKVSSGGLTTWHVWRLILFNGPEARYSEGATAAIHLAETWRIDQQWAQRQSQTTAQQSQIIAQSGQDISNTINQDYWGRQATLDAISERRSQTTLEVEDVVDQSTGQEYRVESGSSYYWVDNQGDIVGTQTDTQPNVDFRQLLQQSG